MSSSAWKQFEREAAAVFQGARFWANSGERVDFAGRIGGRSVRGQCKLVKRLSLETLTQLAEEPGVDVVCVKVRRGPGRPSPALLVFTVEGYRRLHDSAPSKEAA